VFFDFVSVAAFADTVDEESHHRVTTATAARGKDAGLDVENRAVDEELMQRGGLFFCPLSEHGVAVGCRRWSGINNWEIRTFCVE